MVDFTLMQHQSQAIHMATYTPNLFLAWEMGTGKSCATVQIVRDRFREKGTMRKTLIFAPLVVLRNWKKEFGMYSKIDQKSIHILDGPVKKRIAKVNEQKGYASILITNYDAIQDEKFLRSLIEWEPEILVCDESHYLKNYKSKRAKHVALIAERCQHRYLLTGTPILNSTMDLFQQFKILDGGTTFGNNFFAFRAKYFYDQNASWQGKAQYFPKWTPRPEMLAEMTIEIAKTTLRVLKKDCLDLPDLVVENYEVTLSKEQERLYDSIKKEYIAFIAGEEEKGTVKAVVARLAITKVLRLQQIVSGFVNTDDGETIRIKENPRLIALKELLESITPGHKVIVWACFKENYKMIKELCEDMGIKYAEMHGEQNGKEKNEAEKAFNEDPDIRVLISNQSAGGVGVNLIAASYAIYYSRGFRLGDDLQSEARNHRRGSEIHEKITRINLVAPETIDELIDEALKRKIDISNSILEYTKQLTERGT